MRPVGRFGSLVLATSLGVAGLLGVSPGAAAAAGPGTGPAEAGPAPAAHTAAAPAAARPRPITVAPLGTADVRAASATVGGTYRCGAERGLAYVEVHLSQRVRRVSLVTGFGFGVIPACADGRTSGTWKATIAADEGAFRNGPATVTARLVIEPNTIVETTEPVRLVTRCHRR